MVLDSNAMCSHQNLFHLYPDDYIRKLYCYRNAGIREYWIIDPRRKIVTVNYFEGEMLSVQYSFNSVVKGNIYDDLFIDFFEVLKYSIHKSLRPKSRRKPRHVSENPDCNLQ